MFKANQVFNLMDRSEVKGTAVIREVKKPNLIVDFMRPNGQPMAGTGHIVPIINAEAYIKNKHWVTPPPPENEPEPAPAPKGIGQ